MAHQKFIPVDAKSLYLIESLLSDGALQTAQQKLRDILSHYEKPLTTTVDPEKVISVVCEAFSFTPEEIRSSSRMGSLPKARHFAGFFLKSYTSLNTHEISRLSGFKEHSAVAKCVRSTLSDIQRCHSSKEIFNNIHQAIKSLEVAHG